MLFNVEILFLNRSKKIQEMFCGGNFRGLPEKQNCIPYLPERFESVLSVTSRVDIYKLPLVFARSANADGCVVTNMNVLATAIIHTRPITEGREHSGDMHQLLCEDKDTWQLN